MAALAMAITLVTQFFDPAAVDAALTAAADRNQIDRALVHAVAMHESGKNPWESRVEEGFHGWLLQKGFGNLPGWKPTPNQVPSVATELWSRSTSWGTMQTLGETAREMGFDYPWLSALAMPALGAEYGCKYLKRCLVITGGNVRDALLKYNGGGDPNYPDRVLAYYVKGAYDGER